MPTKRSSWKELCHLFLPHSPVTRRNLEWGRYSVETCLSCRAADRRSTSKIRSVSKWSFDQFRSAFLSFTFIYCKYYHDPQWRKAGNYGENESWKTAIPYKYVSIFLGVLLCRSSIYIYIMIIYILYYTKSKNKQSLFRFSFVQGTQCLLSMISGLCLSRLQGGPKIHSTLCLFNVAIENQYL